MRIDSADPTIIFNAQPGERSLEFINNFIDVLPHRNASGFGGAFYIDSVFIGSGKEEGVDPPLPFELRKGVDHERSVCVPKVRLRVDVVDWGCYVEGIFSGAHLVSRLQKLTNEK